MCVPQITGVYHGSKYEYQLHRSYVTWKHGFTARIKRNHLATDDSR